MVRDVAHFLPVVSSLSLLAPCSLLLCCSLLLFASRAHVRSNVATAMNDGDQQPPPQSPSPSGFFLTHDAVLPSAWDELRDWLGLDLEDPNLGLRPQQLSKKADLRQCIPWESSPSSQLRPVAQYGFRYDYEKDVVDTVTPTPEIPLILRKLLLHSIAASERDDNGSKSDVSKILLDQKFTQCIINAYGPNNQSHIPWHVDDQRFGPVVLVYTFGEARPLRMRRAIKNLGNNRRRDGKDTCAGGTADDCNEYALYTAIPQHLSRYVLSGEARDVWEHAVASGIGWRISITFRTLREI